MKNRIKREDYITEEIRDLQEQIKIKSSEERERLIVRKIISKLSLKRKQILLDELSKDVATKG